MRHLSLPRLLLGAAVLPLALSASPAEAQFGLKINIPGTGSLPSLGEDPAKKRQRFDAARAEVRKTFDLFPRTYGPDPTAEKDALDRAEAQLAAAAKVMTDDFKSIPDYPTEKQNLATLQANLKEGRLLVACSFARKAILDSHNDGKPAGAALLDAYDKTVATLDAGAPADRKQNVKFWREEATRLRKIDPEVKPRTGQKQVERTPSEKAKYEKAMREASKVANAVVNDIDRLAKAGDEPIPAARLDELKAAADKIQGIDSRAVRYYAHLQTTYAIENAWRGAEADTAKGVAAVLGGEVAAAGATEGKQLKVTFQAQKGHCYTTLLRYRTSTGQEKIENLEWSAKGGNTPLQPYSIWGRQLKWERQEGVCATAAVPVTLAGELVFAGTRNAVRYVVIDHSKDKFPLWLATYLNARWGDSCDTEAWVSLWTDPIPGSIVYAGSEPFLLTSPDRAGQSWNTLANATLKNSVRIQKKDLSSQAPGKIAFASQFAFPGCPRDSARHPDSVKLAKCHEGITKKYDKPYGNAQAERDGAKTPGAYRAAQVKLDKLSEQERGDRAKQCGPIEAAIEKKWEAAFNKIVDAYADKPYSSPLDRAGELFSQDEAWLTVN